MAVTLYHRTTEAAATAIEREGFRQSAYAIDDRWGVHFCSRTDRHMRPGDHVLFKVVLPVEELDDDWRLLHQADCVDYVVPAVLVNRGRRTRASRPGIRVSSSRR